MVEPIRSGELFGNVSLGQGPAPKHVEAGHEQCAYYPEYNETGVFFRCQHDSISTEGAWYSEDYVKVLKAQNHRVIGIYDSVMRLPELIEHLRKLTV